MADFRHLESVNTTLRDIERKHKMRSFTGPSFIGRRSRVSSSKTSGSSKSQGSASLGTEVSTRWGFGDDVGLDEPSPTRSASAAAAAVAVTPSLADWSSVFAHADGAVGLRNLGNTCFMNSVLQCLSFTPILSQYFITSGHKAERCTRNKTTRGELAVEYGKLVSKLWSEGNAVVSPTDFKRRIAQFAPRFIGYQQQDAQEFLRFLIDGLHEDLDRVGPKKPPMVDMTPEQLKLPISQQSAIAATLYSSRFSSFPLDTFTGQLMSTLTCLKCGHKSNTFDPFGDLSLPIDSHQTSVTIEDAFRSFVRAEELDGDEMPTCEGRCKARQKMKKSLVLTRLPKVLVLHLKRFVFNRYSRAKITTKVKFPVKGLDLANYCGVDELDSSSVYNLHAVSNHMGGMGGGHYTAYCKHPSSGKWYHCNDSNVNEISTSEIGGPEAYLLFYTRSDVSPVRSPM